jgi:CheY-like chemotaxis protein
MVVSVQDTGRGINDTEKIFEPYSQENSNRIDDEISTGLGLYICRKITKLMGLALSVESEQGKGSDFQLLIPDDRIVPSKKTTNRSEKKRDIRPEELPSATILIVDDTPVNLLLASSMLKNTPMKILVAKEGLSALSILRQHQVDVVFTDLHMPQLGGLRLTAEIHQDQTIHQPKIIAQSADAQNEVRQRCEDAGMDGYLSKPFNQQDLFRTLLSVLS